MLRRSPLVAAVLSVVVVGAGAMSAVAVHRDEGPTVYTDPSGDAKGALDVTKVAIGRSGSAGIVTIEVDAAKTVASFLEPGVTPPPRPTLTTNILSVSLDTDRDAATGSSGFEYRFETHGGTVWYAYAWDGTKMQSATFTPKTSFNGYAMYTWTVSRSDIGNPASFAFRVASGTIVDAPTGVTTLGPDYAPDAGTWTYDVVPQPVTSSTTTAQPPAVRPVIRAPSTVPQVARAGRRLTVTFQVRRSDTGGPLIEGAMTCSVSVGGTPIRASHQFRGGTARVSFVVPAASRGHAVRVAVTIDAGGGHAATRVATVHVH